MKTYFDCLPCFTSQALGSLKRSGATDDQVKSAMRTVFCELAAVDFNATPPVTAQKIYRIVRAAMRSEDPYDKDKKRFNEFALGLLPEMKRRLEAYGNTFSGKVKLSIAANIIDFGKNSNLTEEEVQISFDRALQTPVDEDATDRLRDAVQAADSVLFLCDNAGEIVFDRFLIEEMPLDKITCVVKGFPVINDATIDDAETAGLKGLVKIIANGSDAPGTILEQCSPEFKQAFHRADVVIAKGQGNFETLSGVSDKRIFFLLQVKCPIIARDIGYPVGTFVIKDSFEGEKRAH
jgi:damage-control phosphatase, subfamily I